MGKIFVGQTALTIQRNLGTNITGASQVLMKYKKPSLKEGQWTAVVTDALTGLISYTPTLATDINEYGWWTIWAKVTFGDGTVAESEPTKLRVYKSGEWTL